MYFLYHLLPLLKFFSSRIFFIFHFSFLFPFFSLSLPSLPSRNSLHSCHSAINWMLCTALTWVICLTYLRHALLSKPRDRNSSQSVMLMPSCRDDLIRSTHRSEAVQGLPVRYALQVNCVLSCTVLYCAVLSCSVLSSYSIFSYILHSFFRSSRQYFLDLFFYITCLLHKTHSSSPIFFHSSIFFLPFFSFLSITIILPCLPALLSHNSFSFISLLSSFLFSLHFFSLFISFLPSFI